MSTIDSLLERISLSIDLADTTLLCELIAAIRPVNANDVNLATERLRALSFVLSNHPNYAHALRTYLVQIVSQRKTVHLFSDTGITLSEGFWSAAWQRLLFKLLPPLKNDAYLRDVFGAIFHRVDDYVWINGVDEQVWMDLIHAIGLDDMTEDRLNSAGVINELLSAMQVLSYRISAIGLESELVRNYPDIERYESPFLRQNDEINDYIKEYRDWLIDPTATHRDRQHIDVLLTQCEEISFKIRRSSVHEGVSVSLTRLLLRLSQSILRLRRLLDLIEAPTTSDLVFHALHLFKELVFADNRKYSISELIGTSTQLLTMQVTEHAGRSGEHYVANNRHEWFAMLRSASGAGFIVGFMATIKILLSKLALAPFGIAFVFSLNYSLGFMLVHVLHMTIATKQPAMTAALIAKSLDQSKQNLNELGELIVLVFRTQFIAIIGNIMIAIPTAYAIALCWKLGTGHHLITPEKAHHLLHDIDPFSSLSLFHAAIAGGCLFLSGLISGYYDNKSSYNHIPQRLRQLTSMNWLFGSVRWEKMTTYIGNNLGALAGNFFFGIMLGSIGQIGDFLGLAIDIRHITFSSANFAFALVGLEHQLSWQVWCISLLGIALIGLVNLTVSFSLALFVAMRSRQVNFRQTTALSTLLWNRFRHHARDFFFPPKVTSEVSSDSHPS